MKRTLPISKEAQNFLLNLLEEAGIDPFPKDLKNMVLADLAKRLDTRLTLAALEALPEDKITEFEDMISTNKSVLEVSDYLNENIPNVAQVYAKALVEFKRNYLEKSPVNLA